MSLWHPFTQHKTSGAMINIARTQGAYLYTQDGREIIDGIASWWVNAHGHNHPEVVHAVEDVIGRLDQFIFAGFTHEPAQRLADALLAAAEGHFSKVFLSDSGSTAVEAALKMAIGFCRHTRQNRRKILALEGGYHGDTFGAMAAGGRGVFSKAYEDYLFAVEHVAAENLDLFESALKGGDVAAFIFEPLVQGAGGMRMYSAWTLKTILELCQKYGVITIADEVMTGFGRTGTMFACQQAGIYPDIMCLSKALTNGFMGLGATLAREEIYRAFYHDDRGRMFFHSSSFSGNALACAAAYASLKIWEEEPVQERIAAIGAAHKKAMKIFEKRSDVQNIRQCGAILALDVIDEDGGYLSDLGPKLYPLFLEQGVLLRPLGNTVYSLPPYCVNQTDLDKIYASITIALDRIRDERKQQAA